MSDKKFNRESPSVEKLIPQQLVGDSTALIEFLKEYYRFLNDSEQKGPHEIVNHIVQNRDLDVAVDSYVDMVQKEIGYGMVNDLAANKINLYKNIDQFYKAKGSIDSFKLLFRLLFNKNVEISLPKEQILVASDGRWVQQTSLFAEVTAGSAFDLVNSFIDITNPDGSGVKVEVERVRKYNDEGIFEIVISRLFVGTIQNNATFTEGSITGTIVNSLSGFNIDYAGKNFKVGQLLDVVYGTTIGTKIKVTSINSEGGITGLEFLSFGTGYPNEFTSQLVPIGFDYTFTVQETVEGDPSALTYNGQLNETVNVSEYTFLEIDPYSSGYFAQNYIEGQRTAGDLSAAFDYSAPVQQQNIEDNSDAVKASIESQYPNRAIITFKNTAVSQYSGSYSTNKGFLSDDIYLQDNYYYQQFSYVIKADEQFSQYEGIVKQTIHPTGMIMFGEFEITNEIDATAAIELLGRLYRGTYSDVVRTDQDITDITIIKAFPLDQDTVITSQFVYYEFTKVLEDEAITEELVSRDNRKVLEHPATTSDFLSRAFTKSLEDEHFAEDTNLVEGPDAYALDYFSQDYSEDLVIDPSIGFKWQLTKPLTDTPNTSDFLYQDVTKVLTTSTAISDELNNDLRKPFINVVEPYDDTLLNTTKAFSTTTNTSDSLNHSATKALEDSINTSVAGAVEVNPFAVYYFAEDYETDERSVV